MRRLLLGLKTSKATGSDRIPAIFLKETALVLYKHVAKVFSLSLRLGIVPSAWKIADVIALHKKKSKSDPANYRPISLLPILSKLLETIVGDQLKHFLIPRLSQHQFGFRPGRSTIDMLTQITQRWSIAVGKGQEARVVALDISKAFDKVWHEGLLFKLQRIGISGTLLTWFASYLSDRRQRVHINGSYSTFMPTKAGVPQGSVLGPILFLVTNNLDVFADDRTLWATIPLPSMRASVATSLNRDLAAIQDWAAAWLVTYNHTKTELLTVSKNTKHSDVAAFRSNGLHKKGFYLSSPIPCPHPPLFFYGKSIPERPKVKIVGLTITDTLCWSKHIRNIAAKARWSLSYLRSAKRVLSGPAVAVIYKSHIRSLMEYACPIWMGGLKADLALLDKIQLRAVSLIGPTHCSNIQLLAHRRGVAGLCVMHRLVYGVAPHALHDLLPSPAPPVRTSSRLRNSRTTNINFFTPPDRRLPNYYLNSMIPKLTMAWNRELSIDQQSIRSLQAFKLRVNSEANLHNI